MLMYEELKPNSNINKNGYNNKILKDQSRHKHSHIRAQHSVEKVSKIAGKNP